MTIKKVIFACVMGIAGIIVGFIALFFLSNDFQESVLSSIYDEETVYAKNYSSKAWGKIGMNDPLKKILDLLGEPLEKDNEKDGSTTYFYSKQGPKNTNYRVRILVFNHEGNVIEKIEEFYLD